MASLLVVRRLAMTSVYVNRSVCVRGYSEGSSVRAIRSVTPPEEWVNSVRSDVQDRGGVQNGKIIVRKEFLSHMSDRTFARYWAGHQILNDLGGLEACEAAIKAVC